MKRPNILLLYTDQQRWDALGANGNPHIRTPNLDRLAAEGLNFDHFFVQNAVCMPSRVSLLSGLYPATLGILSNGVPVPAGTVVLPHMLRNYGYTSANIGKLHFLNHANRDHRAIHPAYGFDHLEISDEPGCYEDAYRAWVRRKAPDQLDRVSVGLPPATEVWQKTMGIDDGIAHPPQRQPNGALAFAGRSDLTHTAFVAEQTIEYLRAHDDRPFFCIAGFYSPHSPWVAPQEFLDLYDPAELPLPEFPAELDAKRSDERFGDDELRSVRQGYYAMVSEVDHHVGRILACLDEQGLADSTIVVFTSDHGEYLGEHLRYGKGGPEDCSARVPFIVRRPAGPGEAGRTVSEIVEAVDVVPTLLAWAGIPIPSHLQGRPIPHACAGEGAGRQSSLFEARGLKALRTAQYLYTLRADGREGLFDVAADPGQYDNVAADSARALVVAEMRKELARRLIEAERPLPREWRY